MKKYLLVLFALIMIFPMFARAQSGVTVKSIEKVVEDTSADVEELTPAKAEGLVINVDVKFKNVNDKIKYKVVVENKDKEDYQLNTGKDFKASEFITYTYEFDNGSNILKANTTKTMYVTLTYTKEVPDDDARIRDGIYIENNDMSIGVLREEDNPKTGREEMVVIGIVLALIIVIGIVMVKNRQQKYLVLALGTLLVIVPTVNALKEVTITMNTKIQIEKELEFCVYKPLQVATFSTTSPTNTFTANVTGTSNVTEDDDAYYYKYTPGMTFRDYTTKYPEFDIDIVTGFYKGGYAGIDECYDSIDPNAEDANEQMDACYEDFFVGFTSKDDVLNSTIKPKTEGCYGFAGDFGMDD